MRQLIAVFVVLALSGVGNGESVNVGARPINRPSISGNFIVGDYCVGSGYAHGFFYDGKTWTTIDMPGSIATTPLGISGSTVVGFYVDASNKTRGFIYDGKIWTPLDMPGSTNTIPMAIDANNVVGSYRDASGKDHGFLYNGKTWTTLEMPNAQGTCPTGISGSTIVGFYTDASNNEHYFLYNGKTWTRLTLPNRANPTRLHISGTTMVCDYNDAAGKFHGFIYDGKTWTTLDMPKATSTVIGGVSGNRIAGGYEDAAGQNHDVLYDGKSWTTLDMSQLTVSAQSSGSQPASAPPKAPVAQSGGVVPPAYFTANQAKVEEAITWATNYSERNKIGWKNLCLLFVEDAFRSALRSPIGGMTSPLNMMKKMEQSNNFYPYPWKDDPPRGALIFFGAKGTSDGLDLSAYGHIGIYLGDGMIVQAYGKVESKPIKDVANNGYITDILGWSYPPKEWLVGQ